MEEKAKAPSELPTWKGRCALVVCLLCLLLLAASLAACGFRDYFAVERARRHWVVETATVKSSQVVEVDNRRLEDIFDHYRGGGRVVRYTPDVIYEFTVADQTFVGNRYLWKGSVRLSPKKAAALAMAHSPGSQVPLFVNPADPSENALSLQHDAQRVLWIVFAIFSFFLAVLPVWVILVVRLQSAPLGKMVGPYFVTQEPDRCMVFRPGWRWMCAGFGGLVGAGAFILIAAVGLDLGWTLEDFLFLIIPLWLGGSMAAGALLARGKRWVLVSREGQMISMKNGWGRVRTWPLADLTVLTVELGEDVLSNARLAFDLPGGRRRPLRKSTLHDVALVAASFAAVLERPITFTRKELSSYDKIVIKVLLSQWSLDGHFQIP